MMLGSAVRLELFMGNDTGQSALLFKLLICHIMLKPFGGPVVSAHVAFVHLVKRGTT